MFKAFRSWRRIQYRAFLVNILSLWKEGLILVEKKLDLWKLGKKGSILVASLRRD